MSEMRVTVFLFLIYLSIFSQSVGSRESFAIEQSRSDSLSLNELFGDDVFASNISLIRKRASELEARDRYRFLKNQVIPAGGRPRVRFVGEFLTTHPASGHAIINSSLQDDLYLFQHSDRPEIRLNSGGVVASPVIDLVEIAKELGTLEELRNEITNKFLDIPALRREALALLYIISLELNESAQASNYFDLLLPEIVDFVNRDIEHLWVELLILIYGLRHPDTHEYIGEFFVHELSDNLSYDENHSVDVMLDHLRSLTGLYLASRFDGVSTEDSNWLSSSFHDHSTRGEGRPHPHWRMKGSRVAKFSGHETDVLTYGIPLRGNFEFECQLSVASYKHTGFVIGGRAIEVDWSQSKLKIGNYRKGYTEHFLDEPLAPGRDWARFRATIQGDHLQAFFNGRPVYDEKLSPDHDPWLSLRNWRRSHPEFQDIRITGHPVVPDVVSLFPDTNLDGWTPYYEEGFGDGQGSWSASFNEMNHVVLRGTQQVELEGLGKEKLLRYHRPVVENGAISYEFYYEPNKIHVHPALDRLALLLEPDGVKVHWITDGRYESSGLDPFNKKIESSSQRGAKQLPLKSNAWNRFEFVVQEDVLTLFLNGEQIYEHKISPVNQRIFGFFHYADQTEALVRKVEWQGDWKKEIPSVIEQSLAQHLVDELNEMSAGLPQSFVHNFENGVPPELFDFMGDENVVVQKTNGVSSSYSSGQLLEQLRLCLQFGGNFDVIAEFSDLEVTMPAHIKKRGGVGLMVWTDTLAEDSFALYRRKDWDGQKVAYARKTTNPEGDRKYSGYRYTNETTSGKLRMVRRGDRLYSLFAEGDSPNYRLVTDEKIPTEDIRLHGLRLVMQSGGSQVLTTATWNNLTIKAENIYGLPIQDPSELLGRLKKEQHDLDHSERLISSVSDPIFSISSNSASEETATSEGLRCRITSNGSQSHLFIQNQLPSVLGTTDLSVEFEIHELDTPDEMGRHSEVVMETYLWEKSEQFPLQFSRPNSGPEKLTLIIRQKANGSRELVARVVQRNIADRYVYLPIRSVPVKKPDKLRFVAHKGKLYYLYSESDSPEWSIIGEIPFERDLSYCMTSLHQYANGEGRTCDVTWKKLVTKFSSPNEPELNIGESSDVP